METEQTSNSRTATSKLPGITLTVLIALIIALLYIGYEGIADNTKGSEELTNVPLDTTDRQADAAYTEPELIGPEDVDTSTAPVPVDLSQAPAPPDESVAEVSTEPTGSPEAVGVGENKVVKPVANKPKPAEEKPKPVAEKPKPAVEKPTVAEKPKVEKPAVEKPVAVVTADPPAEKPKPAPEIAKPTVSVGGVSTKYTVGSGETFYSIANRYNLKINTLKALNPNVSETDVKSGVTRLNVKVQAIHTVGPGDVLRVVAEKYGVTKEALMRANNKSKNVATRGERLIIPFSEKQ